MEFLQFLGSPFVLDQLSQDKKPKQTSQTQEPAKTPINPQPQAKAPLKNPPKDDIFDFFSSIFSICMGERKEIKRNTTPPPSSPPSSPPSPPPSSPPSPPPSSELTQTSDQFPTTSPFPIRSTQTINSFTITLDKEDFNDLNNLINQFLRKKITFDKTKPSEEEEKFLQSISETLKTKNSVTVEGDKLDLAIRSFEKLRFFSALKKYQIPSIEAFNNEYQAVYKILKQLEGRKQTEGRSI